MFAALVATTLVMAVVALIAGWLPCFEISADPRRWSHRLPVVGRLASRITGWGWALLCLTILCTTTMLLVGKRQQDNADMTEAARHERVSAELESLREEGRRTIERMILVATKLENVEGELARERVDSRKAMEREVERFQTLLAQMTRINSEAKRLCDYLADFERDFLTVILTQENDAIQQDYVNRYLTEYERELHSRGAECYEKLKEAGSLGVPNDAYSISYQKLAEETAAAVLEIGQRTDFLLASAVITADTRDALSHFFNEIKIRFGSPLYGNEHPSFRGTAALHSICGRIALTARELRGLRTNVQLNGRRETQTMMFSSLLNLSYRRHVGDDRSEMITSALRADDTAVLVRLRSEIGEIPASEAWIWQSALDFVKARRGVRQATQHGGALPVGVPLQ